MQQNRCFLAFYRYFSFFAKILILDENFEVKNVWGPRPQYGTELLKKFKENPETYPREEFYNDLQVYYAKNKGKDAIQEILELL
mgnify:CR=1 FL=1